MHSSKKLWMEGWERLKGKFNHTFVLIECPRKQSVEESFTHTKNPRTENEDTDFRLRSANSRRNTKQQDYLEHWINSNRPQTKLASVVSLFYNDNVFYAHVLFLEFVDSSWFELQFPLPWKPKEVATSSSRLIKGCREWMIDNQTERLFD